MRALDDPIRNRNSDAGVFALAGRLALTVLVLALPANAQRVIHVNASANGGNDGSSWVDAYTDLQDALDEARASGDFDAQTWVAAGTYKPDSGTGDRRKSFELFDRVALYGGFGGWEECLEERDPATNETVLSGDLLGDDAGHPPPTSSCCTVTLLPGCDNAECAEVANANDESDITCATWWDRNCLFLAQEFCCDLCRPGRCDNAYNVVRAVEPNSVVLLDGLTITGGEAIGSSQGSPYGGGGLYADGVEIAINACMFVANFAYQGAAIWLRDGSTTINNTTVIENVVRGDGSSAVVNQRGDLTVTDCDFVRNRGGSIYSYENTLRIERCRFLENVAPGPDGAGLTLGSFSDTEIVDCAFIRNQGAGGPALQVDGVASVRNSVFIGNQAQTSGGAISSCGALWLTNSLFVGNRAGGISFYPYETPSGGGFAGALDNGCGGAAILNCTFVNNRAGHVGGIDAGFGLSMRNCILWGNIDDESTIERAQINAYDAGSLRIDHSIVAGWTGDYGGTGNRGSHPRFVDADGPDNIVGTEDDDLRLFRDSGAIDTGNPDPTGLPLTDLDGHARVLCEGVDIGAYEFGIGDYDCSRTVDLTDFSAWQACMTGPITATTAAAPNRVASAPRSDSPGSDSQSEIGNWKSAIPCQAFDFNADGAIDLFDFSAFQPLLAGE